MGRQVSRDIAKLLAEARSHGLTTSHFRTDNLVFRLKKTAEKADAGCELSLETLPSPGDAIALAWSLLRDTAPRSSALRQAFQSGELAA